ncbi:MAG: SDR family oxidoreductase [Sphingomonas sp.]
MMLAVTGGTGFVGNVVLRQAAEAGHRIRALTRRAQPPRAGVDWVEGALDDARALSRLVDGVDAVIHVAGVTTAPDRAGFAVGNIAGTQAVVTAANAAGIRRFVHVSSLAAREPGLSMYGESKAAGERIVEGSALDWAIVRPPAIYGPGELLDLFRMAARGFVLLPPGGRASIVGVEDLARLLLALASPGAPSGVLYEADDERLNGWDHRELARAIGDAVGRPVRPLPTPRALMTLASLGDRMVRGKSALLTADRVRYFCHPDWTVAPARRPPPDLWRPAQDTHAGLADTAAWYRTQGLL